MKMSNITFIAGILCSAVIFFSCSKEKDDNTNDQKKDKKQEHLELITSNIWEITNLKTSDFSIWNTPFVEACVKDNIYTFKTNGTLTTDEGEVKCSETDPQTFDSQWELISEDKMYIEINVFLPISDTTTIKSISSNQLIFSLNYMGQDAEVTMTKKQ
jgi:hypothetical protein